MADEIHKTTEPPWWPAGCQDRDGCARDRRCGYFGCRHEDRYIGAEIELHRAREALRQIGEVVKEATRRD